MRSKHRAPTVYRKKYQVIHIHSEAVPQIHWIGIDLNTTGYAVVVADPATGHVLKLGKQPSRIPGRTCTNCTKLYREGKMWKLKKMKTRERKNFRSTLNTIVWQIVSFAESSCAGIKFEKLFSHHYPGRKKEIGEYEFSFQNTSFPHLLRLVEKHASDRGIPVDYVNPNNTSKICSRCGGLGRRVRKRFECPHCGAVVHADVNAAFNIAATPVFTSKVEAERIKSLKKQMRRLARQERARAGMPLQEGVLVAPSELPARWDMTGTWAARLGEGLPATATGSRP
ncbi:MAG: transposase [Methanoregula sp.]